MTCTPPRARPQRGSARTPSGGFHLNFWRENEGRKLRGSFVGGRWQARAGSASRRVGTQRYTFWENLLKLRHVRARGPAGPSPPESAESAVSAAHGPAHGPHGYPPPRLWVGASGGFRPDFHFTRGAAGVRYRARPASMLPAWRECEFRGPRGRWPVDSSVGSTRPDERPLCRRLKDDGPAFRRVGKETAVKWHSLAAQRARRPRRPPHNSTPHHAEPPPAPRPD